MLLFSNLLASTKWFDEHCFSILIAVLLLITPGRLTAQTEYTFGVVPQQSAQKLARNWGPIFAYISKKTDVRIRFTTAPDIPQFESRMAEGVYDFGYMNPYHYTVFSKRPGYVAFAKEIDKKISGIIVVKKDSPYHDVRELAGSTLVFPSPAAFAASILTRSYLHEAGILFTPKYVKSHDSVYRNVAGGFFPGGGGIIRTLSNSAPSIRDQLRVIWISKGHTPHAIAAHPRIPKAIYQKVLFALLSINDDPHGQKLLEAIHLKGFTQAEDHDWDDVRGLGIDLLLSNDKKDDPVLKN